MGSQIVETVGSTRNLEKITEEYLHMDGKLKEWNPPSIERSGTDILLAYHASRKLGLHRQTGTKTSVRETLKSKQVIYKVKLPMEKTYIKRFAGKGMSEDDAICDALRLAAMFDGKNHLTGSSDSLLYVTEGFFKETFDMKGSDYVIGLIKHYKTLWTGEGPYLHRALVRVTFGKLE